MIRIIIIEKGDRVVCDWEGFTVGMICMIYKYTLGMLEMPDKTMTYLRMFCNSFPIVLNNNHSFSKFEDTSTNFQSDLNYVYILYLYYYIIIIINNNN
jgi:hypothetical protein